MTLQYKTQRKASHPTPPPPLKPTLHMIKAGSPSLYITKDRNDCVINLYSRFYNNIWYFTITAEFIVHSLANFHCQLDIYRHFLGLLLMI